MNLIFVTKPMFAEDNDYNIFPKMETKMGESSGRGKFFAREKELEKLTCFL